MRPAAVAGLAAVAAAAGLAGYLLAAREDAGQPAPPPAETRQIPSDLPDFTLADAAGQPRSIREWSGKSLIINFWATWCPPCRRELPLLNRLHASHADEGFQVIGVAVDFREDVLAFMKDTPIDYPMLIGEQDGLDAVRAFGMGNLGFPFTVFTDRRGRVVTVHVGELHAPQAEAILAAVASVDAGDSSIESARSEIERALAAILSQRTHQPLGMGKDTGSISYCFLCGRSREMGPSQDEEDRKMIKRILVKFEGEHHNGVSLGGAFYHIMLGVAAIGVAISGLMIFLKIRTCQKR